MGRAAMTVVLVGLFSIPLVAQGRGGTYRAAQGIPPGQQPPPGQCRVWYEGVPPGRQPRPTNCRDAEREASRSRNARVIYGSRTQRDDGRWGAGDRYPTRRPGYQTVPFTNGYDDGYEKGEEDARDNDRYDPVRHSRYRSADRGYNSRYGSREQYKNVYRDGFRAGYDDAYRDWTGYRSNRRTTGTGVPWPF